MYVARLAPNSAASSSNHGSVCVLTGATLVLAITKLVCVMFPDVPRRYATAP